MKKNRIGKCIVVVFDSLGAGVCSFVVALLLSSSMVYPTAGYYISLATVAGMVLGALFAIAPNKFAGAILVFMGAVLLVGFGSDELTRLLMPDLYYFGCVLSATMIISGIVLTFYRDKIS